MLERTDLRLKPKLNNSFKNVIVRSKATNQSLSLKTRFLTSFGMTIIKKGGF
jgi:hypothetical protein